MYSILAAVAISEDVKEKVLQEGLYIARISDDTFQMDTPDDFETKTWCILRNDHDQKTISDLFKKSEICICSFPESSKKLNP